MTIDNDRLPAILLGLTLLLTTVWIWHLKTRDWTENREAKRNPTWRVSNHRAYTIAYQQRIIRNAVTGLQRIDTHYPIGDTPLCGKTGIDPNKQLYPLIRYVTCHNCHTHLQAILRTHLQDAA